MTRLLVLLALVGCSKSHEAEQQSGEPSAKTTTGSTTSGSLPEFAVKPVDDGEAQDLAELKERTRSLVGQWLSEETTSDGFIATYEIPRIENVQDEKTLRIEKKQTGVDYGVYVRRMIDGKPYKCVTTHIAKREDVARVVAACKTAKPTAN